MKYRLQQLTLSPFVLFIVIGFVGSVVVYEVLIHWIAIFATLYHKPNLGYHNLPPFVHYLQLFLRCIVWVVLAIICVIDSRKQNFIRTGGYMVGIALAFIVEFIVFLFRFSAAMSGF